jgi:hypothetical protein
MSNAQWHDDQSADEAAMRKWEKEREQARKLVDALRTSNITADDCKAVETLYAVAGHAGSHRIVEAMRYLGAWIKDAKP